MDKLKEILIIEDNPLDTTLLEEYLTLAELSARKKVHAENLTQAIKLSAYTQPDLIFLDLNLPDSNGLETFLSINSVFAYVPIIILSGQADMETALQAIQAGAQDYLMKGDFDEKILRKTIQYSIERKRNQIKLQESNKRYEIISRATDDPVWDWDMINNKGHWNEKVKIFGYPEETKKDYNWWWANIHHDDLDNLSDKMGAALARGEEHWNDNYRFKCADGTYKYIFDRRYIIRDTNGRPTRMIGVLQDVTDQAMLQQKLDAEKTRQQKAILEATIEGQEKERSEIGKELHDNINQILASVKLMITAVLTRMPEPNKFLEESVRLTDDCINEIRRLSNSLMPLREQEIELKEALEGLIGRMKNSSEVEFNFSFPDCLARKLDERQQLTLYRIIQEQINNILKHASAHEANITLEEKENDLILTIVDDGKGFNKKLRADGIGLKNMKSRCELVNGKFCIESEPGKGCTVKVTMPLSRQLHVLKTA
jgi:two-component system sensor histidine kinase UhpB